MHALRPSMHACIAPGNVISKHDIYHAFQNYALDKKLDTLSEQAVTRRMKQYVLGLTDNKKSVGGKRVSVWENIDVKLSN